jgi:hypothetical protein
MQGGITKGIGSAAIYALRGFPHKKMSVTIWLRSDGLNLSLIFWIIQ